MIEIIIGTGNPGKEEQIRFALSSTKIKLRGLRDYDTTGIKVVEDGVTAQENASKKALAYSKGLQSPVLAMDNALYLEGLDETMQPGINVRRIKGRQDRPTDEELLDYYSELIGSLGESISGYWLFAVCIALPDGRIFETEIKSPRRFVSKPSGKTIPGYPIESLQIDPETGKYISEMTDEEKESFWQRLIGKELSAFVNETIKKFRNYSI
ncbi:MAG: non-canonical purine NTP pyrophosphatase [Patescibacteria group bacterium]